MEVMTANRQLAIFPDALRWLWKDWPTPVHSGQTKNQSLNDILLPNEGWQLVSEGYKFTEGPAVNLRGEVFFTDVTANQIHKVGPDNKTSLFASDTKRGNGEAFGPDGRLYVVAERRSESRCLRPGRKSQYRLPTDLLATI